MLKSGLYEQVINKEIDAELRALEDRVPERAPIDQAEGAKVLAKYIAEIVEKGLTNVGDSQGKMAAQIGLANKIITTIIDETKEEDWHDLEITEHAEQLLALLDNQNSVIQLDGKQRVPRPQTSIAQSSLFTGAIHEPQMFTELKKEILSANRIDMLVSFIKWSGLRLLINELTEFTQKGGELRIITTSYMGATDLKAIEELRQLPHTQIKVSYDTKRTRLHAKTYVFYRDTGFTTAYVGSSNLSNAAISSGLEWNVKVTQKDLPETIDKIKGTFDSYWNTSEFEYYEETQKERLSRALKSEKYFAQNNAEAYTFDIMPYAYQQEILDQLEAEREVRGQYKNLLVAATGTGKTVISAFDYKRFKKQNQGKPSRLLFVAHREEILRQSLYTFRGVLKDNNFGDLFVGNEKPDGLDHLFISIQTFNAQDFTEKTSTDFYDYIVVDEFHHAAAPTYQKLLSYYQPQILLGLTATPERMDGRSILTYFNNRIAAEIRLPEAIDRKLLCPFQYFGVTDSVDLESLKWARGGYDRRELSKVYTLSEIGANRRANMIIEALFKYVTDLEEVKGLGFCVSVEHAKFMADYFNEKAIAAIYLTGDSPDEERKTAKEKLVTGQVRFIFVVDIYNEGVDIPEINTVLFLRPTESLTIFLQQLGRGLRLAENKECLTVLDFIGQANKKYNFEDKFSALLTDPSKSITKEIHKGFTSVPKGCYIQLEKKAQKYILDNIRASFGGKAGLVSRIASFTEDSGLGLALTHFLNYYHLDIRSLYGKYSFSRLCVLAGVREDFTEPLEEILTKAFGRFALIDSRRWITFIIELLTESKIDYSQQEERMLQMFHFTIWQKSFEECGFTSLLEGVEKVRNCPVLCQELIDILRYRYNKIDFIDEQVDLGFDCPLDLHCTYTRDQILVAMDFYKPNTVREGVKYLEDKKIDILFVTLNKSDKDYSPTTMYKDYSINDTLFHWQSQSTTSETHSTGQRYINHKAQGHKILLFVREAKKDAILGLASGYTYLGTADYVYHEGSKPMNITWKLHKAIPAKFLKKTNKLIVG